MKKRALAQEVWPGNDKALALLLEVAATDDAAPSAAVPLPPSAKMLSSFR